MTVNHGVMDWKADVVHLESGSQLGLAIGRLLTWNVRKSLISFHGGVGLTGLFRLGGIRRALLEPACDYGKNVGKCRTSALLRNKERRTFFILVFTCDLE